MKAVMFGRCSRTINNGPFFVSGAINRLPALFPIDLSHTRGNDSRANLSNPSPLITRALSKCPKCIKEYMYIDGHRSYFTPDKSVNKEQTTMNLDTRPFVQLPIVLGCELQTRSHEIYLYRLSSQSS